jgi:hypothetical protein
MAVSQFLLKLLGRGLCLLSASSLAFGQSAELSGLVKDPSGSVIPKARLELRNQDTGVRFRDGTNQDGLYSFPSLKPGTYDVTVQADFFRTLTRRAIVLDVGDRANLDFSLQLAGTATSITVGSTPEVELNPIDGAVGTVVDQRFVANMPLDGRSFQSLIDLTPGVVIMPSYQDAPGQFSVNGQRTSANYFTVDGVSANFGTTPGVSLGQTVSGSTPGLNILGGTNSLVSVDSMLEFRIQTSSYAPEYGRAPGAQISIATKSGGNKFHGTAFDYFRNDIFDARNFFDMPPQPKPPLHQNDFGGTLGGPIRKDHTFFFVSYEGLRLLQPDTAAGNFLTAAARAKAPPVYQPFVNAAPLPTGPVNPDGITAPLTVSYSDPSRFDATSFRIDHAANRVTFFARYDHAPSTQGMRDSTELDTSIANIDTATAGFTIVVSPSEVNDFRANWSGATGKQQSVMQSLFGGLAPPEAALFPAFSGPGNALAFFAMGFAAGEVREGTLTNNMQRQLNLLDSFSITAGVHQLKFGVDFRRMEPTNSPNSGYYVVPNDYATLLAGQVNLVLTSTSDPITIRLDNYSLFAQDAWKIARRLTLTYGLRWEINTPPASTTPGEPLYAVAGIFNSGPLGLVEAPLWHTRFHNFAPRIGAAWQISRDMVIRGGFGVFYDMGYGQGTPVAYGFPYYRYTSTDNEPAIPFDLNSPAFQPLPFSTMISPTTYVRAVDPHLDLPVSYQWNVAWERKFRDNQSFTATYAGARGSRLLRQDLVEPPNSIFATATGGGAARVTYNAGYSRYDALQLQFMRRLSGGLQLRVSYTLAKSTDTSSSDVGVGSEANMTSSFAGSLSELRLPPSAPSDFDARHIFSAAISWELPSPGIIGRHLLKGVALDGIVRANSAWPLNVFYQRYFGAVGYNDVQPDFVPGQPFWIPDANQPGGRILNPSAFAIPAGANGDFPRNSLRGFPFNQTDLALRRRFNLGEHLKLDARAEYFNVFNHPMFNNPLNEWGYGNVGPASGFGQLYPWQTLNLALGGGGLNGGQAAIYAPGGPRSAQFTLKLSF